MSLIFVEDKVVLLLKGAPDVLMSKCSSYLAADGSILPCDDAFATLYTDVYERFGGNGERVLGFAMKTLPRFPSYPSRFPWLAYEFIDRSRKKKL